jgi:transposase-like protein
MECSSITTPPPFCPNPRCDFHRVTSPSWRFQRYGYFSRQQRPHRIQRYRCVPCGRHFSSQSFSTSYWLRRADLLGEIFHQLLACAAYRQIARHHQVSPSTVLTHAARLGRHCLLFHQQWRPARLAEPVALDSFISFEYSQYHPTAFHVLVGQHSHFFYGFTDSELRRSGRMTARQRLRRSSLEHQFGRPDPRATERDVAALLQVCAPTPQSVTLHSDEHTDYPRALARLPHLAVTHRTISSRALRTPRNPLFPVNLLDLLIRHSGANHKRETISFSKRRQSAAERMWILLAWRNYLKSFSERRRDATPAMRLGLTTRPLDARALLARRLFPTRIRPPERWMAYYRRVVATRRLPNATTHRLQYAF